MLSAGDHIVSMDDLYGGTNRYLSKVACRMGINTSFVDAVDPQKVADAITDKTRVRGGGRERVGEMGSQDIWSSSRFCFSLSLFVLPQLV